MKKVALSLAGVLAAAAFAPEASAIPSFARQTGMACSSCHTHFPVLNGFGRAFKAAGYTMMGAQEKVEGEHLSIPSVLNASLLLKYRYFKDNSTPVGATGTVTATGKTKNFADLAHANADPSITVGSTTAVAPGKDFDSGTAGGQWQMGDEFSLFFGGRIAETEHFTIGFLMENNVANAGGTLVAGLRVPVTVDLGAVKAQIVPFTTDALGAAYGFELSSGGVMRANRWNELRRNVSAIQYNADRATGGAAAGTAFVLQNDMGFINLTKWSSSFAPGANGGAVASTDYGQSYVRVAATPSIAGFDIVAGVGSESGTSFGNLDSGKVEAKQTFVDVQVQGNVAGMDGAVFFQQATAPACTDVTVVACAHNTGTQDRKAMSIGGEVFVIPHTLILQAAYRDASNNGSGKTDKAVTVGAVYELTQNAELHVNYASYSGTANSSTANAVTGLAAKTNEFMGMLEMAW